RLGVAPEPTAPADDHSGQGPLIRVVGRAISDYFLRSAQVLIPVGGSLPTSSVLVEIVLANTKDMNDAALDAWVGSGGRSGQPVSVVEVARRFFLSKETARRHVHLLEERGLVVRVRRGLLAIASGEEQVRLREIAQTNMADTRRFFATLDRAGVLAEWAA
ncbi:MAG: MarR family transcriptional regulator, partial [Caulobacter sp.]